MSKMLKRLKDLQKKHNREVIKRMRDGDPLKKYDNASSWFPPRPVIEKDPIAIKKLYPPPKSTEHPKSDK